MTIELREITSESVAAVLRLSVAPEQARFVSPNAHSLAEALFSDVAWYRGVWRDDELVGFLMIEDQSLAASPPPAPIIAFWRHMVDQRFQRQGIGQAIVEQVAERARVRGFDRLYTSYVVADGGPEHFYRRLGFVPNGEMDDGEDVAVLMLGAAAD